MAGERIFVVEDNETNRKLTTVTLRTAGFDVRTAADAEEAMKLLATERPQLILMDLQLPGMDGLALTKRLKADAATRDIVIVALTAYAMPGDEARALAAGCDGYVSKPIDTRALGDIVTRHLAAGARP